MHLIYNRILLYCLLNCKIRSIGANMKISDGPVIIEEIFTQPAEKVWQALTNPIQMRAWFFENIPNFEPTIGFKTAFNVNSGERNFLHLWHVLKVEPLKKIVYNWKYDGYKGDSNLMMELKETDGKTALTITHTVLSDFEEGIPEFSRESCIGGWTYFINQNLKDYLKTDNS